jgi:hypothetical protein
MSKIIKTLDSLYLHISNSGVTFKIQDRGYGPVIAILSSAFGNIVNEFHVTTDKEALKALGEMFTKAADLDYSEESCVKASIPEKSDGKIHYFKNGEHTEEPANG